MCKVLGKVYKIYKTHKRGLNQSNKDTHSIITKIVILFYLTGKKQVMRSMTIILHILGNYVVPLSEHIYLELGAIWKSNIPYNLANNLADA